MSSVENNIIFGGPKPAAVTGYVESFGQFVLDRLKNGENIDILINSATGEKTNCCDLYNQILRLISCLSELNIGEGDVIGICSENRIEFAIVLFSGMCLNATIAPYNVSYTERELEHAVNLSRPKLIFASETPILKLCEVAKRNPFIQNVITFSENTNLIDIMTYSKFINNPKVRTQTTFYSKSTNIKENVSLIMCSSGTTGLPKGVQITQKNILSTIDSQFAEKSIVKNTTVLSIIPWFHSYGCVTMMFSSLLGAKLVFLPKFEEETFLRSIQKYKVNRALLVPPLMVFLAKHPSVNKYDLSSLQILFSGAAPLGKETEDAVKKRIGVPSIRQGYGLSECTLSVLVQTEECIKLGSVGKLTPGIYAKVLDTESGEACGPFQRGELCFKGDFIMKGYIGDAKATNETIDKNGWLHTGDIGYYDNDLEFFIVDRIKELIKYKGYQVAPAEIEALLLTYPKIRDAAVVGLPDEYAGELPFAFIVKQPNIDVTEEEVINFVATNTSPAKKLRGGVKFIGEIPKNPSGKILRRILKDKLKEIILQKTEL